MYITIYNIHFSFISFQKNPKSFYKGCSDPEGYAESKMKHTDSQSMKIKTVDVCSLGYHIYLQLALIQTSVKSAMTGADLCCACGPLPAQTASCAGW